MPKNSLLSGAQLKEARLATGLSQTELATKLGVSQTLVSNWEIGKLKPNEEQQQRLRETLPDVSLASPEATPLAAWLTKTREAKGLTVQELAEKTGLSAPAIYNIESGRITNPRASTRDRIEGVLESRVPTDAVNAIADKAEIEGLGELVDFDAHDDKDLPEEPGIYVFYDISDRPIYVGQGGNIKRRIHDHRDKFWFRHPIVSTASYVRIDDDSLRKKIEKLLIKFLKSNAVINQQGVERD